MYNINCKGVRESIKRLCNIIKQKFPMVTRIIEDWMIYQNLGIFYCFTKLYFVFIINLLVATIKFVCPHVYNIEFRNTENKHLYYFVILNAIIKSFYTTDCTFDSPSTTNSSFCWFSLMLELFFRFQTLHNDFCIS